MNYSILAGQIGIYFQIFDSLRLVTTNIWFWYFLLNCFTPAKTIKLSKCAKNVSWKWFLCTFQKCFHEKEANVAMEKSVRIQDNLYQHGAKIILYFFMGLKLPKCIQIASKTSPNFYIPQMTWILIYNPKTSLWI